MNYSILSFFEYVPYQKMFNNYRCERDLYVCYNIVTFLRLTLFAKEYKVFRINIYLDRVHCEIHAKQLWTKTA